MMPCNLIITSFLYIINKNKTLLQSENRRNLSKQHYPSGKFPEATTAPRQECEFLVNKIFTKCS